MRRSPWLLLAALLAATPLPAAEKSGDGYKVLGDMAVMDQGRVKPLHTLAANRVKSIYSRQSIKLLNEDGTVREKWDPVAALIDWSARPDYWDDQPFIFVASAELMSKVLAGEIKAQLNTLAQKPSTSAADRATLEKLAAQDEPTAAELKSAATLASLSKDDQAALHKWEARLLGGSKWVSPNELQTAEVLVEGRRIPFTAWFRQVLEKQDAGEMGGERPLSPLEKKVAEVGGRLATYQTTRDHHSELFPKLEIAAAPHPSNAAYLKYAGAAFEKVRAMRAPHATGPEELSPIEQDAFVMIASYLTDLQPEDHGVPGTGDAKFDERFARWLKEKAAWVPLPILLNTDEAELTKAGFPADKVLAFRQAYRAAEEAEKASPGALPVTAAQAATTAARDLGAAMGDYPSPASLARESHFNRFAPFFHAPEAYGLAVLLLLISLGTVVDRRPEGIGKWLYWGGMLAFLAGIGLEVYGFYLRVRISGWAPVTNMYETVIWVALVTSVIGLILELFSRRVYPALAASGVALLATILAANVSLLDPTIGSLQPVLRSNYWLTIHVLTIVSSYAAFALALGLGLLAVGYYLTATYRRRGNLATLAAPLLPGLPLLAVGALGVYGSYQGWGGERLASPAAFYSLAIVAALGGMATIMAIYSLVGELANRAPAAVGVLGLVLLLAGAPVAALGWVHAGPAWLITTGAQYVAWTTAIVGLSWMILSLFGAQARATLKAATLQAETLNESAVAGESFQEAATTAARAAAAGGTATLTRPTVAEIRARAADNRPKLDPIGLSMQTTAGRIKPLANFVYRAMQVGVLLVAAGTILGGIWADYSWGRFWGWDPKEVWALITLLVYLVPLHGRFAGWVNSFGLVMASVACFMSVLMAWYGVNFVLGVGLHSYGFVEGGGQGIVISCALAVLAVALGASWRRRATRDPLATMA
jgi:ABC-type transport system involved in cytochrome c biogenesis permease subunit